VVVVGLGRLGCDGLVVVSVVRSSIGLFDWLEKVGLDTCGLLSSLVICVVLLSAIAAYVLNHNFTSIAYMV
jgi:hypothetical protein